MKLNGIYIFETFEYFMILQKQNKAETTCWTPLELKGTNPLLTNLAI